MVGNGLENKSTIKFKNLLCDTETAIVGKGKNLNQSRSQKQMRNQRDEANKPNFGRKQRVIGKVIKINRRDNEKKTNWSKKY